MKTLHELFVAELQDLYSTENQILKILPKLEKTANSEKLKLTFRRHYKQTQEHVIRLETIADELSIDLVGKKSKGIDGLIKEGKELLKRTTNPEVRDAALIGAAQRVEHYEIAGYGCVRTYAKLLGYMIAVTLLQKTLEEEEETDHILTNIAESGVNKEAVQSYVH